MVALLIVIVLAAAALLAWPPPIESHPFQPSPVPALEGGLEVNRALEACDKVSLGAVFHADKLAVNKEGHVYAGDDDGRIHHLTPDGRGRLSSEVISRIDGRPMGLSFAPDGSLVVANLRGPLFEIDPQGEAHELVTPQAAGGTVGVEVARDGTIYYSVHPEEPHGTDVSSALLAGLEANPSGELRSIDPVTGKTHRLVGELYTPVGVALSANEDFVAVNEFFAYRVTRYWLKGPKAGTSDRLVENLPGVVDGIASDGKGTFYVTMPGLRSPILDWMHPRPQVKNHFSKLMLVLLTFGVTPDTSHTIVAAIDESGTIRRSLHDSEGRIVNQVTDAVPFDGSLYVTSIANDWIARCPLQAETEAQE